MHASFGAFLRENGGNHLGVTICHYTWTCSNLVTWDRPSGLFELVHYIPYIYRQAGWWLSTESVCCSKKVCKFNINLCNSYK